jgi:hypothetical protein
MSSITFRGKSSDNAYSNDPQQYQQFNYNYNEDDDYNAKDESKIKRTIKQRMKFYLFKFLKFIRLDFLLKRSEESNNLVIAENLERVKKYTNLIYFILLFLFVILSTALTIYYCVYYTTCTLEYNKLCQINTNNSETVILSYDSKEHKYYHIDTGIHYENYCYELYNKTHYYLQSFYIDGNIYESEFIDSNHEIKSDDDEKQNLIPIYNYKKISSGEHKEKDISSNEFIDSVYKFIDKSVFSRYKTKDKIYVNITDIYDSVCIFEIQHEDFFEWLNNIRNEDLFDISEYELKNSIFNSRVYGKDGIWTVNTKTIIDKMNFIQKKKNSKCLCAFEFGFYKNIILLKTNSGQILYLLNTNITSSSKEKQGSFLTLSSFFLNQKIQEYPVSINVNYLDLHGNINQHFFERDESICISYCLNKYESEN